MLSTWQLVSTLSPPFFPIIQTMNNDSARFFWSISFSLVD
jgi:hypothetical protein